MGDGQTSRRYRKLRREFRADQAASDAPCWICRMPIDSTTPWPDDEAWELDHLYPRSTHPQHAEDPANFRSSHRRCNGARGNSIAAPSDIGTPSRDWIA